MPLKINSPAAVLFCGLYGLETLARRDSPIGRVSIVGFDSAWTDRPTRPGAVCVLRVEHEATIFHRLQEASFAQALEVIRIEMALGGACIVALDQPTIVPNERGMRPVDRVAASYVSFIGGGVQPANQSKVGMFDEAAPIWRFTRALNAAEQPEAARTTSEGVHLIEVFPALALPAFEPAFGGRKQAPRYNPTRVRTFKIEHWQAVAMALASRAGVIGCGAMAQWATSVHQLSRVTKGHQDKLDAVLCALIGHHWRFAPRAASMMLGDLQHGYMIAPVTPSMRTRLENAAGKRGVPIDGVIPHPVARRRAR
jgi:predicted RNase H-like nuclease